MLRKIQIRDCESEINIETFLKLNNAFIPEIKETFMFYDHSTKFKQPMKTAGAVT